MNKFPIKLIISILLPAILCFTIILLTEKAVAIQESRIEFLETKLNNISHNKSMYQSRSEMFSKYLDHVEGFQQHEIQSYYGVIHVLLDISSYPNENIFLNYLEISDKSILISGVAATDDGYEKIKSYLSDITNLTHISSNNNENNFKLVYSYKTNINGIM